MLFGDSGVRRICGESGVVMKLSCFVALTGLFVAHAAAAAMPVDLPPAGLIVVNPQQAKALTLPVYQEPSSQAASLGNVLIQEEANPTRSVLVNVWEEKNPNAGLFGKKTRKMRSVNPVKEYITSTGQIALYAYEAQPNWVKLENGWVKREDLQRVRAPFVSWQEALTDKGRLVEFVLPNEKNLVAKNLKLDAVRPLASFSPLGEVPVFNAPGDGTEVIKASAPLRFAIIGYQGDWVNVMAVLDSCAISAGSTDYREGTNGWVRKLNDKGQPSLIALKDGSCN